jgi:endonuclease/exonuclease/phosphatase family metal-dependent hydrolase
MDFFHSQKSRIDIFCLQEVWDHRLASEEGLKKAPRGTRVDILSHLIDSLAGFQVFFAPAQDNAEGVAFFVKNGIKIDHQGDVFVFRSRDSMVENDGKTLGRNLQFIQFKKGGEAYTVCHFHGLWTGDGKGDTPSRIDQSKKIKSFLKSVQGSKKILCGDFNLLPETQSIKILEDGMRNLIKEYGIRSTRNDYYQKKDPYADYVFVSGEVNVKSFRTLPVAVSDHLPLYLEFF